MTYASGRHFLQIPGPTNIPDRILRAIDQPIIDHRGPRFAALGQEILAGLKRQNARLAILSNGTPDMLKAAVQSAGIEDYLDAILSIEEIRIYKPDPRVYALATDRFGVGPSEISLQSSNRWDIAGAKAFGFQTVWINRTGQPDEFPDLPADRTLKTLHPLLAKQADVA